MLPGPSRKNAEQLDLPLSPDPASLKQYLAQASGKEISLILTDNSTVMVSTKRTAGRTVVRLHRKFLEADVKTLEEIAGLIRGGRGKTPLIRSFIRRSITPCLVSKPLRRSLRTAGRWHDLRKIYDAVNSEYFDGRIEAPITWGRQCRDRRYVRRRTLGSYSRQADLIRINPLLDKKDVPVFFLEFIVYHEMLHADMEVETGKGGRRVVHSREFRRRERMFNKYAEAIAWEKGRW